MANPFSNMDPAMAAQIAAAVKAAGGEPSYEGSVPLDAPAPKTYNELEQAGVAAGGNMQSPPAFEQAPADTTTSDTASEGDIASMAVKDAILNKVGGGITRPAGQLVYGENYAAVGGEKGKERFDTLAEKAPDIAQQGLTEGAQAASDEGAEMANFYNQEKERLSTEAAAMRNRQLAREGELQARQEQLDRQTEAYTKNLSNGGAFWQNPGNILAAIGFALMPFGANDPNIGIKTLMGAIQQDFNNRKTIADGHLGALRSNLQGYRQIAGDAEAGDLLAQQEAYRIAAQEVERIASKYKGPKAQAAAKVMIGELQGKVSALAMEIFNKAVLQRPGMLPAPIAKAVEGGPGYTSFVKQPGQPGQAASPQAAPAAGTSTSTTPALSAKPQGPSGNIPAATVAKAVAAAGGKPATQGAGPDALEQGVGREMAKTVDKLSPGMRNVFPAMVSHITNMAKAHYPNATPEQIKKYAEDYIVKTQTQIDEASKRNDGMVKSNTAWAYLQSDMSEINQFFKGDKQKIEEFVGALNQIAPGTTNSIDQILAHMGYGTSAPGEKARVQAAGARFRQLMASKQSDFYHERAGSALSPAEKDILNQVISPSSTWDQKMEFVRKGSSEASAAFLNTFAGGNELARHLWQIRMARANLGYGKLDSEGKRQDRSTPEPKKPAPAAGKPNPASGVPEGFDWSTVK